MGDIEMGLFINRRNTGKREPLRAQRLDAALLERIVSFAEAVDAPGRSRGLCVRLSELSGSMPYVLLIGAAQDEQGYLDAGYAAGQVAAYLRFLGLSACILRSPAPWMHRELGGACLVAVSFGREAQGRFRKKQGAAEQPCISCEYRKNWTDEVSAYVKKRFPAQSGLIRTVYREDHICLNARSSAARRSAAVWLEAGIAAAGMMAAAEALWIDLVMVECADPDCLVSLCRRKDRARVAAKQETVSLAAAPARTRAHSLFHGLA